MLKFPLEEVTAPFAIELSGRFNTTTVACSMGLLNSSTTCPEIVPDDWAKDAELKADKSKIRNDFFKISRIKTCE